MLLGACGDDADNADDPEHGSTSAMTTGDDSTSGMETSGTTTTNGTSTSTTGVDTTDESGSTGGAEITCEAYCGLYAEACVDFSEYANEQHCLEHCAQWPVGAADDTGHDSLGCRIYHATVAKSTDPDFHCPHSGPSGDGVCVRDEAPDCDLYCTRYFNACTDDLNAYADTDDCMMQCSTWYPGSLDDVVGHTVGCRAYHAQAALGGPDEHCPHAGPGGGGVCVL